MLEGVLGVLQWKGRTQDSLEYAESAYTSMLAERLGASLGELEKVEPERAAHILRLLDVSGPAPLRRVLLAPEMSCRLLWGHPGACDNRDLWQFLSDALEIESGSPPTSSGTRWSALGNVRCNGATGESVSQPPLAGLVIDADSPAAICFGGENDIGIRLQHYRDPQVKETALRKMERAMLAIDAMEPTIASFGRRFTLVASIVTDGAESGFSSGSTDQYIGRSIFWNAHLTGVSTEVLAEAIVHEAIHSLLYMHEVREPWFLFPEQYSFDVLIESPWTGAKLRLEPFLQACFVWFGLTNFWTLAQRNSPFDAECARERLNTARRGFTLGPLLSRIAEHVHLITPNLLELIRLMQDDIMSAEASM
jgi:hypothetical protein